MNSDFVDLDGAFMNLDASKNLEDGATYRFQCTAGGRNVIYSDVHAYIVISDSEPANREEAAKSAIILAPGGDPYEYRAVAGRNAWAWSPFGVSSLSINAVVMA